MHSEPQKQHQWLQRLVGEWESEVEGTMGPDQPPFKSKGVETVRPLGDLWILAEGEGEMPGGGTGRMLLTLGYDPQQERFVGTFVGSMMTYLWVYRGTLDAAEKVLTLDTEGPGFTEGEMAKYQDIIEIVDDDHRIMRSQMLAPDGTWQPVMTAHYRRKK